MQSVSSQRTLAREGVRVLRDGQMVELVAPGGCDQDLPACETALGLFDVLAASVTFNLEQCPVCLIERRYAATQAVYDGSGAVSRQDAPDLWTGLSSRSLRFARALDRGRFLKAVEAIPASVFRAKGIIDIADPPQTMLFQ